MLRKKKRKKKKKKRREKRTVGVFGPSADVLPPKNLKEAQRSPYWSGFREAIEKEITQLEKNNTWEYIEKRDLPTNTNILKSKFVFDIKRGPGGIHKIQSAGGDGIYTNRGCGFL